MNYLVILLNDASETRNIFMDGGKNQVVENYCSKSVSISMAGVIGSNVLG